ncbi:MAG TPA: hypothetical protein PKE27_19975 [Povalibacter sp.]|uniref:hypothetical protein n=1 Tax=Povalibacter sp. TaxID=1962978 RepID=UPI002B9AE239|nr:hypothetical protein [Povalibacter sp.]HMN46867.1 hypothetical protein [Povalibacter sp.]
MENESQEHQILELGGPHGSLTLQALLMGDHEEAGYAVIATEADGFKGSSSFHFDAIRLAAFVRDLDRLRQGEDGKAVFELPQYPDCQIIVQPAHAPEFASVKGVIGSVVGVAPGLGYRLSVRFGFYFERRQLDQLCNLYWSRAHVRQQALGESTI